MRAESETSRNRVNALIRSAKHNHYTRKIYNARFNSYIINELRGVARKSVSDLLGKSFDSNLATRANSFVHHFATSIRNSSGNNVTNAHDMNITLSCAFFLTLLRAELRSILFS